MVHADHAWVFLTGQTRADYSAVIVGCTRCGLLRSSRVPTPDHERHIDLSGTCPGEPQAQDTSPVKKA